jgi:hypothetical protein
MLENQLRFSRLETQLRLAIRAEPFIYQKDNFELL